MWIEFVRAISLIFFAEMGDKTQILAMAFATKYKVRNVLIGILIGSFLNHGLAVILGSALSTVIPVQLLQVIAGVSFVGFALWTLKLDDEDEEEVKKGYGPIVTVALAFFIGELGDKTQLTAIVLATDASYPLLILLGTVTGMVITGGIGIYVGSKLGSKIPEFTIKMVSASVFMLFGVIKLWQNVPSEFITPLYVSAFILVVGLSAFFILRPTLEARRLGQTAYQQSAQRLYDFYHELSESVEEICLGTDICGSCQSTHCVIGATKHLLKHQDEEFKVDYETMEKKFNNMKIIRSLEKIISYLDENESTSTIDLTKKHLELILFKKEIPFINKEDYINKLKEIDPLVHKLIQSV